MSDPVVRLDAALERRYALGDQSFQHRDGMIVRSGLVVEENRVEILKRPTDAAAGWYRGSSRHCYRSDQEKATLQAQDWINFVRGKLLEGR